MDRRRPALLRLLSDLNREVNQGRDSDETPPPVARTLRAFPSSFSGNNYRSEVINGMLKFVECPVDLLRVEIDKAQTFRRKTESAAGCEFQQRRNFTREM